MCRLQPLTMKQVVLLFPDTAAIADFLIKEKISNAQVDSIEQTVTSKFTNKQISTAEKIYKAMLKKTTSSLNHSLLYLP